MLSHYSQLLPWDSPASLSRGLRPVVPGVTHTVIVRALGQTVTAYTVDVAFQANRKRLLLFTPVVEARGINLAFSLYCSEHPMT